MTEAETIDRVLSCATDEEIQALKTVIQVQRSLYSDPEDIVTEVGRFYVSRYGRPTEYSIYFGVGAYLIRKLRHDR